MSFFLYNAKSTTKGICEIYLNSEPYPLVGVSKSNEKAKLWLSYNLSRVKDKLSTMSLTDTITREDYVKPTTTKDKTTTNQDNRFISLEDCQRIQNEIIRTNVS
jgi:hypothetical protein